MAQDSLTISHVNSEVAGRPHFEAMLADVFVQFVHLPGEALDGAIEDTQRRVCECLEIDRSILWRVADDGSRKVTLTHIWEHPSSPPVARNPAPDLLKNSDWALAGDAQHPVVMGADASAFFPRFLATVERGETIIIPDMDALPESLARERDLSRRFGTRALVVIPLIVGGKFLGALTFQMVQQAREWPDSNVCRLRMVAQVFADALARRQSEAELRDSRERLDLAAEGAGVGLWSMDIAANTWWITEKARHLFGIPPGEVVDLEGLLKCIDPEDRATVKETIATTIASGSDGSVEYRVRGADGNARWLLSRGRVRPGSGVGGGRLVGMTVDITARRLAEEQLKTALVEVQSLRDALQQENMSLREEIRRGDGNDVIAGESPAVVKMLEDARCVGPTDSVVLITGETGTGKELLAEAVHGFSQRAKRAMVKVNCAALPPTLIESELFGRERGAYTGAMTQQAGRFEAADGSTIFLDEIGELPLELQPKLLRVLQEGHFERLGSNRTRKVDARVIAATNRDLEQMVKDGRFRADLYYRLSVFPITVPPLRERKGDIPILVWKFVRHFATKMGKSIDSIPRQAMDALARYPWPGNIRELRNLIERAVILSDSRVLRVQFPGGQARPASVVTLEEAERAHILAVLAQTDWRISGPNGAAAVLGLVPTTLHSKIKKLGLSRPRKGKEALADTKSGRAPAEDSTKCRQSHGIS